MSIIRKTRRAIEGGSTVYGLVEANNGGFITVRLLGSGSRLTNLSYIGSRSPQENDQVIVDYSTGNRPTVYLAESQIYSGEAYMLESQKALEMLPAETDSIDGGGAFFGGLDIGFGITTKVGSSLLGNEPHNSDTSWIQHWGINRTNWQSAIYDSADWDDNPIGGKQYFTVGISGIYMLSFTSLLNITGVEGSNPLGSLRVRVMRTYGIASDVAIMKGVSPASAYNSFYNIDINKVVYLPAGEVLSVEVLYTGDITGYAMKNSNNPLKWLATQNEMIFKAQMIYQVDDIKEPEVPSSPWPYALMIPEYHSKWEFSNGCWNELTVVDAENMIFRYQADAVTLGKQHRGSVQFYGTRISGSFGSSHTTLQIYCSSSSGSAEAWLGLMGSNDVGSWTPTQDPQICQNTTPSQGIGQGETLWYNGGGAEPYRSGWWRLKITSRPGYVSWGSIDITFQLVGLAWGSSSNELWPNNP